MDELVDVVNKDNQILGSKMKSLVHRDGDLHRSVHLWIFDSVSKNILLQRRSFNKDTNAGMLDVSVGGHVASGEAYGDAWREIHEELGIAIKEEDIHELGVILTKKKPNVHLSQRQTYPKGILENELCLVAISPTMQLASRYSFDSGELDSIIEISLEGFKNLFKGIESIGQ